MESLPMVPGCALDESGLGVQRERYRRIGQGARVVDRGDRTLTVELGRRVDVGLVGETIAAERECCPFFALGWDPDRLRLTISVTEADHRPGLEAIAFALGVDDRSREGPTPSRPRV